MSVLSSDKPVPIPRYTYLPDEDDNASDDDADFNGQHRQRDLGIGLGRKMSFADYPELFEDDRAEELSTTLRSRHKQDVVLNLKGRAEQPSVDSSQSKSKISKPASKGNLLQEQIKDTEGSQQQAYRRLNPRLQMDEQRSEMARLQRDFMRQLQGIVKESSEFSIALDLEINALRDAKGMKEIESRRNAVLQSLESLSESHQQLTKKFDTAQTYFSIIETDHQKLSDELDRVRLLSLTDELTSLPNRRAFMQRLEDEISRSKRYGFPLTLVLVDIDHFKKINDRFGHSAGDAILQSYANNVFNSLRNHDMIARYGGEEFAVLMPNTDVNGVMLALEKIKARLQRIDCESSGLFIPTPTFSAGVAEFQLSDTPAVLIERADMALYRAKNSGRNRIEIEPGSAVKESTELELELDSE